MLPTLLYFGSFNPPHNGHTSVARFALERGISDQLWFVVSPCNPFKQDAALAPDADRLEMTRIAVRQKLGELPVEVCDVEFSMPRPSYTIDTMERLRELYPDRIFSILAGADILDSIREWKDAQRLMLEYRFYIYPRGGRAVHTDMPENFVLLDGAPLWDFSSTDVRRAAANHESLSGMVSPGVEQYILEHGLYGI